MKDVALGVVSDIFFSLQKYEEDHVSCAIFVRCLSGDEDIVWKYLFAVKKLVSTKFSRWDVEQYRIYIRILYPYRSKEWYEQMELEHIAFTRNRFTKDHALEHLKHMLERRIEPTVRTVNQFYIFI